MKGRPTSNPKQNSIRIRVSDQTKEWISCAAKQQGITISELIRNLIESQTKGRWINLSEDIMWIVQNARVYGIEESIKASKYPMTTQIESCTSEITQTALKLANSKIGEGHDNYLMGIVVQFDLTFTNKAWIEAERYHFFDIVSSQSTIHCVTKFDLDKSYCDYVDDRIIDIMKTLICDYNKNPTPQNYLKILYSNPSGFLLTARITTNYRQLKTIYQQRKKHKLPEWRIFCKWIESLPNAFLITGYMEN